jgi:hypothetical protein
VFLPDCSSAVCARCGGAFSLLNRRHHCRFCGCLCCAACSRLRRAGHRACDGCGAGRWW